MSEITELERRLTAAMDRIGKGLEGLSERDAAPSAPDAPAVDTDAEDVAKLRQDLEDERLVTAQLEERIKALHRKHDERVAALEKDLTEAREALSEMGAALESLKKSETALQEDAQALRSAGGAASAEMINASLSAELDTMRAARAAEQSEARAIKAALEPLLTSDAKGGK
ncbi:MULTISPECIES: hypothetical protein [Sediminimonas]|uniref:hypothetical protein n=1 Tax=Sediminimonas TaxID=659427 RepID=UPI0004163906|nr:MULTISPECIES: hypothetical protein [Sediminimonas]MDR9484604.1 hypothetical protein [Sediminimonas sp.]